MYERTISDTYIELTSRAAKETLLKNHFWVTGFCVDTVVMNAEMIRCYVRYQEEHKR